VFVCHIGEIVELPIGDLVNRGRDEMMELDIAAGSFGVRQPVFFAGDQE
jgi:hypothetical protein